MEQALQERKSKLNSLLIETEKFWEAVDSMGKEMSKLEDTISSQQEKYKDDHRHNFFPKICNFNCF